MPLRFLFVLFLFSFSAAAQSDSGLRGRALFLELESARRLPPAQRSFALANLALRAAEPSRALQDALAEEAAADEAPGSGALLRAAQARVAALAGTGTAANFIREAERGLSQLHGDTATQALQLIADAAGLAGLSGKSAAYRELLDESLRAQPDARLRNLDALSRISNEPGVAKSYGELLRTPSLSESDRVHILSRLLINLCRLGDAGAATGIAQQLNAALRNPPIGYDAAETALARALWAELRGRAIEAASWFTRISTDRPSPSVTEGLIALADFHSRGLRPDSALRYLALARQGPGFRETPGLAYLWQQAQRAHEARYRSAPLPAAYRARIQRQDSLYRSELQSNTRELGLQYELLESAAKTRALRDQQQLEALRYQQQRQRTWIALLLLGCLSLLALGATLLLAQRRRHAARLHAAELERRDADYRNRLMTELAQAQEAERGAIAGQLHDEIGTLLSVARMNLSAGGAPEQLQTAGKLLGEVAQTVRAMSHQLMPVALQQYGFRQAVEQLVADINAADRLPVELVLVGFDTRRFNDLFYSTCYRMVQELLQNVLKHSGAAHALLQLVEHPDSVSLLVEDDGRGLPPETEREGQGLRLLSSRVAVLQGSLHLESSPGGGTTVLIDLPVQPVFLIPNEHATTRTDLYRG